MLRTTIYKSDAAVMTLQLAGRLVGIYIEEPRQQCVSRIGGAARKAFWLNLLSVSYVDSEAIAFIRTFCVDNAINTESAPFVAELFKEVASDPRPSPIRNRSRSQVQW